MCASRPRGVSVNEHQQTSQPDIYAIGDVIGDKLLAHVASHQGVVAAEHALGRPSVYEPNAVPACTFTHPEIASVGLTEEAAKAERGDIQVGMFPFQALGRARAYGDTDGFVKIVAGQQYGEILGMHVIGPGRQRHHRRGRTGHSPGSHGGRPARDDPRASHLRRSHRRIGLAGNQRPHPPPPAPERTLKRFGRATTATRDCRPRGDRSRSRTRRPRRRSPGGRNRKPLSNRYRAPPATTSLPPASPVHIDLDSLDWDSLDAVLEAASQAALRTIAPQVLKRGVNLVALSAGATLDGDFLASILSAAQASGARIWVPSGAIGALDVIRAARVGDVASITLTTTKPPVALVDAPWVVEQGIDLTSIDDRRVIFSGGPVEAVRGFPQNVNVAALLALAADDPDRLRVTVVADPAAPGNVHEVEAIGSFGSMRLRLENRPSETNPKTSALAAQSVIALLRQLGSPLRFA